MCGIFGVISVDTDSLSESQLARAKAALSALHKRGPDGQSFEVHRNAFFGHTRLSIIDLSEKATQPLKSIESGNLITVNGEIYDYKKIRRELGIEKFYSDSDSEVLLIAYDQKGLQGVWRALTGCMPLRFWMSAGHWFIS